MGYIDVKRARFLACCHSAVTHTHERYNIGTLREKTLHLVLKNYFTETGMDQEVPMEGYIADIAGNGRVLEIQTSAFAPLRDKLEAFLPLADVTVVYPIAERKWISWIHPVTGDISEKKRSPATGRATDIFGELVYLRRYLTHPRLKICAVLLETEEYRLLRPTGERPRRGEIARYERIPIDILGAYEFASPSDYTALIPFPPGVEFTANELFGAIRFRGGSRRRSGALTALTAAGAIERTQRRGRAWLYRVPEEIR